MKYFKNLIYILEFVLALIFVLLLKVMGIRIASLLAAKITQFVGKRHASHRVAYGNLTRAMPHLSANDKERLLDEVWMKLGMVFGEFPHVGLMNKKQVEKIVHLDEASQQVVAEIVASQQQNKGTIMVSAHFGNWEAGLRYLMENGVKVRALYRPLNNPYVDWLMRKLRKGTHIAKGRDGLRQIINEIKRGNCVVILADQKVTDGVAVDFFHDKALTTTSVAKIVQKYDVDLLTVNVSRKSWSNEFEFHLEKVAIDQEEKQKEDFVVKITENFTNKIQGWIEKNPSQWFWVHDRWKK